jgi:hypothetical protein
MVGDATQSIDDKLQFDHCGSPRTHSSTGAPIKPASYGFWRADGIDIRSAVEWEIQ